MKKISRRTIFPIAGLAPFGIAYAGEAPQIEPLASGALRVVVIWRHDQWQVCLPDFDTMDAPSFEGWHPGKTPQWKWVPLSEYLDEVKKACGIGCVA